MAQRKIIFLHIPKTAGTSLREVFVKNYNASEVALCYEKGEIGRQLEKALGEKKQMIFGHIDFQQLKNAGSPEGYHLLSFFRHPLPRTISHYLHFLNNQEHDSRPAAERAGGFEAFLDSYHGQNWQCQFMAGMKQQEAGLQNQELLFEEARKNLEKLDWLGVTNRYQESLLSLRQFMQFSNIPQKELNTAQDESLKKELREKYEGAILERNAQDLKLYHLANARLDQQLKEVPGLALRKLALRLKKS